MLHWLWLGAPAAPAASKKNDISVEWIVSSIRFHFVIRNKFSFQFQVRAEVSADLVEKHKKLSDKLLLMVANSNGTMKLILEETILISSIKYSPPPLVTLQWSGFSW